MRFWIGGEIHQEVSAAFLPAAHAVSKALNAELENVDSGIPVKSWNVIGILLPASIPGFDEVRHYDSTTGKVEFRIRLHYFLFQAAESPEERQWIIFKMILRSVDLFRDMADLPSETGRFRAAILAAGQKHGWGERLCEDDDE